MAVLSSILQDDIAGPIGSVLDFFPMLKKLRIGRRKLVFMVIARYGVFGNMKDALYLRSVGQVGG
jgi:hypothetical protein